VAIQVGQKKENKINKNRNQLVCKIIKEPEMNRLIEYLYDDNYFPNNWFPLSHNVEKLNNGTEKHGIGKFLYTTLNYSETDSQISSHIATIFYNANLWEWNNKKRGMEFKKKENKLWCDTLKNVYLNKVERENEET